jgi:hypothetical protein
VVIVVVVVVVISIVLYSGYGRLWYKNKRNNAEYWLVIIVLVSGENKGRMINDNKK